MPTDTRRSGSATPAQRRAILAASIALLGWLVYLNALNNPFVFDDPRLIVENAALRDITRVGAIVWHDISRPLVNLSYAVDFQLWGAAPLGFHVTSVLLHVVNIVLMFVLASALPRDRGHSDDGSSDVIAPVAAALFAVHPMMSQAVGYVSARSELMCATFVLTSFLCARQFMRGRRALWLLGGIGAWILSIASKEIGAMLPALLIAYDYLVLRPEPSPRRRNWIWLHGPLLGITALAAAGRVFVLLRVEYASAGFDPSLVLVAADAIRRYVMLLVYPTGQTVFHVLPFIESPLEWQAVNAVAGVALLVTSAWMLRRSAPLMTFGMAWFLLLLIPSSVLFVLGRGEPLAEHRVYTASIGLFLAAGAAAGWVSVNHSRHVRLAAASVVAVVAVLAAMTVARNRVWSDPMALWSEAVAREPQHWFPRLMLGEAMRTQSGCAAAEPEFRQALVLRPQEPLPYERLGGCQIELRQWVEAERTFEALSGVAPQSAAGPIGLGIVAMMQGGPERSRVYLQQAIERDRSNVTAMRLLATLEEPVRPDEALRLCREVQRLAPATPGNDDCLRRLEQQADRPPSP